MISFDDWCFAEDASVGRHTLRVFSGDPARLQVGISATAAIIPGHFAAAAKISRALERLGKTAAAEFVLGTLPTTKSMRSGDTGEILATEYITSQTGYDVPIKRLRWKDHRDMAMRGDDVIGIAIDPNSGRLKFLKTEAKSRVSLATLVVTEARNGLDKDNGLPSAHSLSFISSRLFELGKNELADAIDDAQLRYGIPLQNVEHLIFTFTGNNPANFLKASLKGYAGTIRQSSVGVRVTGHAKFVSDVYEAVVDDVNDY
jgi:hypothetical protein